MPLPNEISFIFSPNDKGDNPKRPDWRGEVIVGDRKYKLAAWKRKKGGTGREFISGKLTFEEPKGDPGAYQPPTDQRPTPDRRPSAEFEEDVPF
jgi:hypothetical protein